MTGTGPGDDGWQGQHEGHAASWRSRAPHGRGVISPLLANLYINRFLKFWRLQEKTTAFRAHIVSYADDFVILSRGHAVEASMRSIASSRSVAAPRCDDGVDTSRPACTARRVMTTLGLTINEAKTLGRRMPARSGSTFLGPRPARTGSAWMASGIRATVHRRKAWVGSRTRSATSWCRAIWAHGPSCPGAFVMLRCQVVKVQPIGGHGL